MSLNHRELKEIARQLRFLANEGHGGSEARLVKTLDEYSHRLHQIANADGKQRPKPRLPRLTLVSYLVLAKLIYDLLTYLLL